MWGRWFQVILVSFLASLFGASLSQSGSISFNTNTADLTGILNTLPPIVRDLFAGIIAAILTFALMYSLFIFLFQGTIQVGYCRYLLNIESNQPAGIRDLFSYFHIFGKTFVLNLLRGIYVALWSMLFVFPGIVAAYRYAMAPFILAENPGMTANEAITASKERMRGRKFDLFVLDLSFIGWNLLSLLTLGLLNLWVTPYRNCAYTAFYRQMVSETKPEGSWNQDPQDPRSDLRQQRAKEAEQCFSPNHQFYDNR